MPLRFPLLVVLLCLCSGCGTSLYQPARDAGFRLDDPREIDDEAIAKAFAARPQMPDDVRVAFYLFDDGHAEQIEATLRAVPGVVSTYQIPSVLVSGARKHDARRRGPSHQVATPQAPSLRQLRLLAARAHADLLVVVDHGHQVTRDVNGLMAFGIAIVPLLFVPWRDIVVESYADSYLIDVRNGYLYGQASADRAGERVYRTIYADEEAEMVEEQLEGLLRDTGALITKVVEEARREPLAKGPARGVEVASP